MPHRGRSRAALTWVALCIAVLLTTTPAAAAIRINPRGPASTTWGSHVQSIGNRYAGASTDIVNGGNTLAFILGTEGRALRLEEITTGAMIVPTNLRGDTMPVDCFRIQGHVQDVGWQQKGSVAGTRGKGLRLEAVRLWSSCKNVSIQYQAHVQDYGWQSLRTQGQTAGTTGEARRIEALRVVVTLPDLSSLRDDYRQADRRACELFGAC